MRRILASIALLGCLGTPATATTLLQWLDPSPAAVILGVGKWLTTDREKIYKVRVQCTGVSEEDARNNCFAKAINDAIGSVVVNDSETTGTGENRELTHHELINYSSGWVHDYQILNKENQASGGVQLTMQVSVQGNAIAARAFGTARATGELDGNRISNVFDSYQKENAAGDNLIDTILRGFPNQAFTVTMGKPDYKIDSNRDMYLNVNFSVEWNKGYVTAMGEVLDVTGKNVADPTFWALLKTKSHNSNGAYYKFDRRRGDRLLQGLTGAGPQLLLWFGDRKAGCYNIPELSGLTQGSNVPANKMIQPSGNGVTINSWLELKSRITVRIAADQLNSLGNPKLEVVDQSLCL